MTAVFSSDRRYRYALTRDMEPSIFSRAGGPLVCIGLNPSTADETKDDPTIRRLRGFAERWGHSGLVMLNLYAFRSTDPDNLWKQEDPVGPENDAYLLAMTTDSKRVLCAWGNNARKDRHEHVLKMLSDRPLCALRVTQAKRPEHPLYLPNDLEPVPYGVRA